MSRIAIKEWYSRVNAAWPAEVPPLTFIEGKRAVQRLYRWATGQKLTWAKFEETSGNRYSYPVGGIWYVNPDKGWKDLIHQLSHYLHRYIDPGLRPHDRSHARLELRLVNQVVKRGYLYKATLKPKPKTVQLVTPELERERKIEKRREQVKRLERKIKSLTTRLHTARRSLTALERAHARSIK